VQHPRRNGGANESVTNLAGLRLANPLVFLFARTTLSLGVIGCALVLLLIVRRMLLDRMPDRRPHFQAHDLPDRCHAPLGSPVRAPYGAARDFRHDPRG